MTSFVQRNKKYQLELILILSLVTVGVFVFETTNFNSTMISLSGLSRLFNSFFAAMLTSLALIISLTSNLYSPKLIKVLLRNKIIIYALGLILVGNLLVILSESTPHDHEIFKFVFSMCLSTGVVLLFFIGIALYNMAMLMKPSYFLPKIEEYFYEQLAKLKKGNYSEHVTQECFSSLEVMINIGKMSSKREDVKVVFQVIEICQNALIFLIESRSENESQWRKESSFFVHGLSEEGKRYLERESKWPEAYLFYCMRQLFDVHEANKNEIISLYSSLLLESLEASIEATDNFLVEMHIMAFNSLLDDNIVLKKEKNISTLGHSFSMSIQLLVADKKNLRFAFKSYFHRFKRVHKLEMYSSSIYLMSDLSKSLIMMANEDEEFTLEIYDQFFKQQWDNASGYDELKEEMFEMIVRLYWELKARKHEQISEKIFLDYIREIDILTDLTEKALKHSRVLCYELNDRLIGHTFISKKGHRAIQEYLGPHIVN